MTKRPLCIGAVFLVAALLLGKWLGAPKTAPPILEDAVFSENEGKPIRVFGQVKRRERTAKGTRLYLGDISFLPSDRMAEDTAEPQQILPGLADVRNNSKTDHEDADQIVSQINHKMDGWLIAVLFRKNAADRAPVGCWVTVEGKCELPAAATNPGQFDARAYYLPRKVIAFLYEGSIVSESGGLSRGMDILTVCRERLCASYAVILSREDAAVISAITMGDRTGLTSEDKRRYQEGGIAHILAISSLHITLIGREFYRLLRKRRLPFAVSGGLAAALLLCFCLMTGMSVSAVRACIMFCLWLGSQMFGRTSDSMTGAALAAAAILMQSAEYLWDSAFLLSFGCVLALHYLTPLLERLLPVPGKIGKGLRASAAVQIGTMPVTMYFFYQISPYAVLVNLAVLPCMALLMAVGLFGGIIGLISVPVGTLAAAPCHYLLRWFDLLCRWERKLPGAVWITGRPAMWQIVLYYGILSGMCAWQFIRKPFSKNRSRKPNAREMIRRTACGWMILGISLCLLSYRARPGLRITFLDVGQGDGILIEAGAFTCMIDGGSSTVEEVWKYRIESTLKYYGISRLDAVLLSHGDQDHICGIEQLLEGYEPNLWGKNIGGITLKHLLLPDTGYEQEKLRRLRALAKEQNISVEFLGAGGKIGAGGLTLDCLYPDAQLVTGNGNEDSMVLRLKYGTFSALFTGDLEGLGEQRFLEEYRQRCRQENISGAVTVLKVAHHGSKNATSEQSLKLLRPELAVISCGKKNQYGHPAKELLERLSEAGTKVLRTDQEGAVTIQLSAASLRKR